MWLLFVGVAVGVLVTALLRAWSYYERTSTAGLVDRIESLEEALLESYERIQALEAIASSDEIAILTTETSQLDLKEALDGAADSGDDGVSPRRNPNQGR